MYKHQNLLFLSHGRICRVVDSWNCCMASNRFKHRYSSCILYIYSFCILANLRSSVLCHYHCLFTAPISTMNSFHCPSLCMYPPSYVGHMCLRKSLICLFISATCVLHRINHHKPVYPFSPTLSENIVYILY